MNIPCSECLVKAMCTIFCEEFKNKFKYNDEYTYAYHNVSGEELKMFPNNTVISTWIIRKTHNMFDLTLDLEDSRVIINRSYKKK